MESSHKNPIIEIYKGRKIRRYNMIELKVSIEEFKQIIDLSLDHNKTKTEIIKTTPILCKNIT